MKSIGLFFSLLSFCVPAFGEEKTVETLKFHNAKVFMPLKGSVATAGYAKIENLTAAPIDLKIVRATDFKAVELHETMEHGGKATMKKRDVFKIEPKKPFELKQGGHHVMLFDASKSFKAGDRVDITFTANGKEIVVPFEIVPRVASQSKGHSHH